MSVSVVVTLAIKAAAYIGIVTAFVYAGWIAAKEIRAAMKEIRPEKEEVEA